MLWPMVIGPGCCLKEDPVTTPDMRQLFLFFSYHGGGDAMQAFYAEFGELMMRQPVIGLDFQSYLPTAIVPYMLLLVFNVFNRYAFPLCTSACVWEFALPASLQHHHQARFSKLRFCLCPGFSSSCLSWRSSTGVLIHLAILFISVKSILSVSIW